jgi:hypothetical protein
MSVKFVLANKTNKQALEDWDEFLQSIRDSTPIDINETDAQKQARIKHLEKPGNEEEWFAYYFPKYCFSAPAKFHKKSTKIFLKSSRIYHTRAWARGLSKSTRRMFEFMYKKFVQRVRINMLLISKTEDNAIRLLSPYRANLESNQRLLNDYGIQKRTGKWKEEEFITRDKSSFRAVGMGQNPRGAKLEEMRVNAVLFDDADDDEVCLNEDRLNAHWNWIEQAVIPTVEMSKDYWICFDNNIIAEDSLAVRAAEKATHKEVVNWRDENNVSTWPEKNKESDIDYMISILSYESVQKEGFNNPMTHGKTFKEITWGKCPPLKKLAFVIVYGDPATSNRDKPTVKSKANNSGKSVTIIGGYNNNFYLYKAWLDNTTNHQFTEWYYEARDYVGVHTQPYMYIENNSLQDPFFTQVIVPLMLEKSKERKTTNISLVPDTREKPDKWFRIEGTLEPLVRVGRLVFNIDEKDNPHMKRMEAQFKAAKPTSKRLDGPDCVEGGVFIANLKMALQMNGDIIENIPIPVNSKRF